MCSRLAQHNLEVLQRVSNCMGFLLPRHRISDVFNFSALTHCWLGKGKGIWPVKKPVPVISENFVLETQSYLE